MKKFISNIRGFFESLQKIIKNPEKVSGREYSKRRMTCELCEYLEAGICKQCWCVMKVKWQFKDMSCPLKKW